MTNPEDFKRMKRREYPGAIHFITFSCEHRLPLLGTPEIRDLFVDRLAATRARFSFDLFAWVVMPEHVHLLLRCTRSHPTTQVLDYLKRSVAARVLRRWHATDAPILHRITRPDGSTRFWQKGGGFDRNVRDNDEFAREVRYIHVNPVSRGLVPHPHDWTWSSARWWLGESARVACDPAAWIPEATRIVLV